jgi:hypothetical protein
MSNRPLIPVGVTKKRVLQDLDDLEGISFSQEDKMEVQKQVVEMVKIPELQVFKEKESTMAEALGLFDPRVEKLSQEVAKKKKGEEEIGQLIGLDPILMNQLLGKLLGPNDKTLEREERERERLKQEILKPPPNTAIEYLQGKFAYLQITYLIERLIQVFGVGSYTSVILDETKEDVGKSGTSHFFVYTCKLRVTINTPYLPSFSAEDVGTGVGQGSDLIKALDTAIKSARTDAFKRCCKDFGPTFGSVLYSKTEIAKLKKK